MVTFIHGPTGARGIEAPASAGRVVALDGVRGIAIWMVLAWHFYACVPHPTAGWLAAGFGKIASYGLMGVPLFFVLSGFLIGQILIRHRGERGYFSTFYARRFFRIVPCYVMLLAAVAVATVTLLPRSEGFWGPHLHSAPPAWSYLLFLQNIFMASTHSLDGWLGPTWSLAIEEQFYLVMPVVVVIVPPRRLPWALGAGMVLCWGFRFTAFAQGAHVYQTMLTLPGRADGLLVGVLLAWAWETPVARQRLAQHARAVLAAALLAGVVFVAFREGYAPGWAFVIYTTAGFSILSVFFAGLVLAALLGRAGVFPWLLRSRVLVFSGAVSYFVYLFHTPVNAVMHAWLLRSWPRIDTWSGAACSVAALGVVGLLAVASRHVVELPCMAWGRRFRHAGNRSAAPESAPRPAQEPGDRVAPSAAPQTEKAWKPVTPRGRDTRGAVR